MKRLHSFLVEVADETPPPCFLGKKALHSLCFFFLMLSNRRSSNADGGAASVLCSLSRWVNSVNVSGVILLVVN